LEATTDDGINSLVSARISLFAISLALPPFSSSSYRRGTHARYRRSRPLTTTTMSMRRTRQPSERRSTMQSTTAIDDHTRFPYTDNNTDTWDILNVADEDPNDIGRIIDVYRNESLPKM